MLPDLESLRCFEAAATQLNFRRAAKAVALSPAAFGDRIRRLEDLLGTPLFARTTRRVVLLPAGQMLLPQARRALDEARRCLGVVGAEKIPSELTIGTRYELGLSWLTPALGPLAARHPEWTLHLHFGDSPDLLARVKRGTIDCAITSVRLTSAGFQYGLLHAEDYVFVGSAQTIAKRPLRSAADASEHVLLDAAGDLPLFRYFLDAVPQTEAWMFARVGILGTIGAIRQRVLEGAGVAVLPRYFVAGDLAKRRLTQLMPRVRLHKDFFRLIWRRGHVREEELRLLGDELRRLPLR